MGQVDDKVIAALKVEASRNVVFKDVCHMFSVRKRTAGRLTVSRLKQAMDTEGFKHSRKAYEHVLQFLGSIGLGQIGHSPRGKVRVLSGIKIKLQSIGQVALSASDKIQVRKEVPQYQNLVMLQSDMHEKTFVEPKPVQKKTVRAEEPYPAFLTIMVQGKPLNIPANVEVTSENIGEIIMKFKSLKGEAGV